MTRKTKSSLIFIVPKCTTSLCVLGRLLRLETISDLAESALVVGDNPGIKVAKAAVMGTPVWTQQEFEKKVGLGEGLK